jgi:hypothetical protein
MRGLRSTILLIVVLGGLGAYIYFVTWKKSESTDIDTKQEKVFAALQADKIDDIRLKSSSGDTTTLKKADGGWQLVAPVTARADEGVVSTITSSLASTTITRVVEDNAADLKAYGLGEPRIDVAFKAPGEKDYRHLLIGEKSPAGDLFAKRSDDKRVVLIPASEEAPFNRSTFDLRDKALLKFDREKVDGIGVTAGGKPLQLAKEGGDWKITKPVAARADFGTVESLVSRLEGLQMKSIVAPEASAADLKKYGFDKPDASVDVSLGSARATLLVGGKSEDGGLYVRDTSKPAVMTVDPAILDDLKKGAEDYRRKDIFEFRAFNATHVEFTRNGQTFAFDRVKGQGDKPDTWRRGGPKPGDVALDKMDGALSKLANLRATSFVDAAAKTGLDAPVLTVFVRFDAGKGAKEERVSFGKVGSDTFASRPGEPGAAKLEGTDFDDVVKALDELTK